MVWEGICRGKHPASPIPIFLDKLAEMARNGAVALTDVGAALIWVGATNNAGPNLNGRDYDNDDNANGASFYVSKIDVDAHTQDLVRNLGTADVYYYYPAVGLTTGADVFNPLVGVAMSWSSNSQNPSGAFMLFNDFTNSAAGQFWNVAGGASTYNVYADGRNRWGDYMGIHRDWSCGTIWGVTQFTSALNTWRTRITELAGIGALPAACRLIFDDGFERGSSLNWSSTSS